MKTIDADLQRSDREVIRRNELQGWFVAEHVENIPLTDVKHVWTGAVLRDPAKDPHKTYAVTVDGDVGRVDYGLQNLHLIKGR